jgi:hypothetical protein
MMASRVMMFLCIQEENQPDDLDIVWRMAVWDWETGDLVRKLWL